VHVVVYLGRRENASIPNLSLGSWVKILGESLGMLRMIYVSLMSSLSNFWMLGTKKGRHRRHILWLGG
jgi:hypothetical protein